jgi:alkylation response protein AidB-like acyl-CoA dehydrogenase
MAVLDDIEQIAELLETNAAAAEELGRLTDESASALRASGVIRMLQPKDFGGLESHPVDFFRAVLEIGSHDPSAGWVAGVVGVHPHELAHGDRRVQAEVWGEDPDTWVASPYAPMGRARPVDGGYVFNGRWNFSSGTDHCQWVMIGGLVTDQDGNVAEPDAVHFLLPRSDYEIVQDSWDVMGLRGTGSKDLVVRDAFVPAYRTIETKGVTEGTGGKDPSRESVPLFRMPRNVMFSGAITTATLAMAKGTLAAYVAMTRSRQGRGGRAALDPFQLSAMGAAAADIDASVRHVLWDVERVFEMVSRGEVVPLELRAEARRNQVQASQRAAAAADSVFRLSGGASLHHSGALQRRWRDTQAALHHVQNGSGPIFQAYGLNLFGHPIPGHVKI